MLIYSPCCPSLVVTVLSCGAGTDTGDGRYTISVSSVWEYGLWYCRTNTGSSRECDCTIPSSAVLFQVSSYLISKCISLIGTIFSFKMVLKHLFVSHLLLVTALVSTLTIMMHAIESNTSSVIGVPVLSHIAYPDNPVAKRAALITTPLTTATHTTSQEKS